MRSAHWPSSPLRAGAPKHLENSVLTPWAGMSFQEAFSRRWIDMQRQHRCLAIERNAKTQGPSTRNLRSESWVSAASGPRSTLRLALRHSPSHSSAHGSSNRLVRDATSGSAHPPHPGETGARGMADCTSRKGGLSFVCIEHKGSSPSSWNVSVT